MSGGRMSARTSWAQHEVLVIIQGAHGYISPGWYDNDEFVPTWNHATAHLYGTPEILSDEENFRVLSHLVDHFEKRMPRPGQPRRSTRRRRATSPRAPSASASGSPGSMLD